MTITLTEDCQRQAVEATRRRSDRLRDSANARHRIPGAGHWGLHSEPLVVVDGVGQQVERLANSRPDPVLTGRPHSSEPDFSSDLAESASVPEGGAWKATYRLVRKGVRLVASWSRSWCLAPLRTSTSARGATAELLKQIGRSVDIGGRTLNIHCTGEGNPTVSPTTICGAFTSRTSNGGARQWTRHATRSSGCNHRGRRRNRDHRSRRTPLVGALSSEPLSGHC